MAWGDNQLRPLPSIAVKQSFYQRLPIISVKFYCSYFF